MFDGVQLVHNSLSQNSLIHNFLSDSGFWLAQVIVQPNSEAAKRASFVFSGPQFLTALVTGVVLAFAFQLLLTNLGVATGISILGGSSDSDSNSQSDSDSDNLGDTIRKISFALGLGTLISVALALFVACSFAVKLGLYDGKPYLAAIVGLAIWATYFTILVWVSSTTVGSLIGSVVSTATSGFQTILGTAASVIGGQAASKKVVSTAEAAAAAVRRELGSAIDPVTLKENVEEYIETLRPAKLDVEAIARDFEGLLDDENLQEIAGSDSIRNIDRQTFAQLISDRSDLSQRDINRIADKLESVWRKSLGKAPQKPDRMAEFANYISTATREQLVGENFSDKLDDLVYEMRQRRKSQQQQQQQGQNPMSQPLSMSMNSLMGLVMGRADLSDLDVEKITERLQQLRGHLGDQTDKVATRMGVKDSAPRSTVRTDIENYLYNATPWQLKANNLQLEFRDLMYDPSADPGIVADELRKINRGDFRNILEEKGMLTQDKIKSTANLLEAIRLEVLSVAEAAQEREASIALLAEVENYLLTTRKQNLTPESIHLDLKSILEDPEIDSERLTNRLAQFDRPTFERILEQRQDMSAVEISVVVNELEMARDEVIKESEQTLGAAKAAAEAQWRKVQSYLRDTGRGELNPKAIENDLKLFLDDPQAGASILKARASQFDRQTLVGLLTTRNDLTEAQVNEIIDTVEDTWSRVRSQPGKLALRAQQGYEQAVGSISKYLRQTGKAELSPQGIKRDLKLLFNDPQLGAQAIRRRLAAMDRDTIVQLLAQRDDLDEEQVNQVIDEVQSTLREVAKAPRRLATRTQEKVQDFQGAVSEYLRSTEKEELNPEGIKRDVQLLLNDPRAGFGNLQERLTHFDRSTLVALLTQRGDLSEAEVNNVLDQISSVREQVMSQLQMIQGHVQAAVDRVLEKIRNYLNSLERPELNYEGIKYDIQTLFDDPEAGFDALRDRFSRVDRDTLVALMSSRDDISKADAERIIRQIERNRDRVLQRAERIQQEAQMRVEKIKAQAQRQAEETRKAAAVASWWLFLTALVSAIASAAGGVVGVTG